MTRFLALTAVALLMSCANIHKNEYAILFETIEKDVVATDIDNSPATLHMEIDIPKGKGELFENAEKGLRQLIAKSQVGHALKA